MSRAASRDFPWLRLHQRLASMHYWQERLTFCGLGAMLLSFVAWLLGAHLVWHLGFIALGTALGFMPRLRSGQGWALRWLDLHLGLSYRTALEVPRGEDRYGFYTALHRRVERAGKNLEKPSPQPWWLPLFAVAFGLLLVPSVPWSPSSPLSSAPGMTGPDVPGAAAADDLSEAEAEDVTQEEATGEPEGLDALGDDPGDLAGPAGDAPQDGRAQSGRAPEDGGMGERETLENFLRSFDEEADEASDEASGAPEEGSGEDEGGAADERRGPAQAREDDAGDPGERGEPGEGEEGAGEGDELQAAEAGEEGAGTAEPQTAPAEEGEGGAGQGEEEEGDALGQEGAGEEGAGEEGAEAAGQAGGGEGEGGPEGDAGDELDPGGAGAEGISPDAEVVFEALERDEERPEFLPGERSGDGAAASGVMRLPGGGEAEGPAGAAPQTFGRGLERAITEGRIPVEYHEVLRDYFR